MKQQLPITSSVDELQRNVRSRNPSTLSIARQSTVSLEQPHVNHQSPTLVSGDENISSSSDTPQGLQELDGSTSPCVCTQCGCLISYSEPPPSSDPLVPSTAQNLGSNITASEERSVSLPSTSPVDEPQRNVRSLNPFYRSMAPPLVPPAVPDIIDRSLRERLLLLATAWNPTMDVLREQSQYRTSQGQTSNPSQYQNSHIIPAVGNHDMDMDIDSMNYEELLALEDMIGKVNTGVKTSEFSKFVKEVICCGEQDEAERCVICLEQYVDADAKGQLKCGHEYHLCCIGKWLEEQAVCPICRQRAVNFEQ